MADVYEVTKASGEKVYRRFGSQTTYSSKAEAEGTSGSSVKKSSGSKVQTYYTSSGQKVSVGVETIGGEQKAIIVGSPEAIEEISPSRKSSGGSSRVQQYLTPSGSKISVGTETIGGQQYEVAVGSPEAIQEITLKRQLESDSSKSYGVYDTRTQQTRIATPIESAVVSKRLSESQMSYAPGSEPKQRTIKDLLSDPSTDRVYFTSTPEGVSPVLIEEKPKEPNLWSIRPTEKKKIVPEGFFKVGSENFLDVPELAGNIAEKGTELYKYSLDPQFEMQNPEQFKRTLKGTGFLLTGAGISFAGGVVEGFTMPFRHPIETAKGLKDLVFHPISSTKQIGEQFVESPFKTAGEFYGFGKSVKVIKRASPIEIKYESFGKGGAKTFGLEVGYEWTGRKAVPLVSYIPEGVIGEGFVQPKTLIGTKLFKERIGEIITEPSEMLVEGKKISPELQRELAIQGIEAGYELRNVESKFFTKEILYEQGTKGLSSTEARALFENIGKQKGKVFGSYSSMPQLEPSLKRAIGDIEAKYDITSESMLGDLTKQNLKVLQDINPKGRFRILESEPFHIEKFVDKTWEKVAEFKGEGIGEGDVAPAYAFGYDLWTSRDFMKVDRTTTAMLRGELKRKLAGSIGVRGGQPKFSKYQGLTPQEIAQGFEFHHIDYLKNEGVVLSKAEHSLIHDFMSGKKVPRNAFEYEFFERYRVTQEMNKINRALGVTHTGRFKDVADYFRIVESLEKSKKGRTSKSKKFLELAKELEIDYRTGEAVKFEILEKKLSEIKSPSLRVSPSVRGSSPSVRVASPSPSIMSPEIPSPSFKSPSVKSPSPRISPSLKSLMSPSVLASVRSPSPSVRSPSVQSPYTSPSPSPSPSPSALSPSVFSPNIPVPMMDLPRTKRRTQPQREKVPSTPGLAYIPDFTAKALGLTMKIPKSEKDLKKLLRRQYSGLEIARFGIQI